MKKTVFSSKPVQWITLISLALVWGSSFILMKRGLEAFAPDEIAAYRIFIVFFSLSPFVWKYRNLLLGPTSIPLLMAGVFGSALPYFLFIKAQTEISSSLSGILNSLTPIFTLLFAVLLFKQKFKWNSILGIFLGFVGAVGLIYFSGNASPEGNISLLVALPIVAAASYGLNVNLIKRYLQETPPMAVTAMSFAVIGPLAGIYLFGFSNFSTQLINHPKGVSSFIYISILGVVGTALAVWLFNMLIKETSALFASSVTYLIPVVAVMWGVLDGESFYLMQFFAALIVLLGISLINSKRRFEKRL